MKNIKDITISIFAIIGFVAILSSFNNQTEPQVTYGTPESHVWGIEDGEAQGAFLFNKVTGEIKQLSSNAIDREGYYMTMIEK